MMNTPMTPPPVIAAYGRSAEEMVRRHDAQCLMGHMGDAWDIAYAALFPASNEAKYITGTELVVDGGLTVNCVRAPPSTPASLHLREYEVRLAGMMQLDRRGNASLGKTPIG